jgi:hypothetical protein
MEAVRKSQPALTAPPTGEAAPPKLTIEKFGDGGITCLKFVGTIDESFDGKKIARSADGHTLVLDLGGVKKISSFGIREWVDFVGTACKHVQQLVLIECAPKVVDQLNMVANFTAGGRVFSFYTPFRCDYCDSEHRVLLDVAKDFEAIRAMKLADRPCPSCKESMYFDEDGSTYFSYLAGQGSFELESPLVQFLAAKLDYRIGTIDSKVRVDKAIEGRVTYLRLAGDLNNTFPRDKLVEGLEGVVIADVSGITRIEPAGAAEWRGFVQQVAPLVEQLHLIGVTPAFLERLCGRDDLGAKGQVIDFQLPYTCGACGTTSTQSIDVAEHHGVVKFATAPELHCPECKAAMQCTASEAAMTVLPGLPKPVIAKDLARTIDELRARKLDKKPSAGVAPLTWQHPAQSAPSRLPLVGIAVLVAALAAGVIVYLKSSGKNEPSSAGLGRVVAASSPARPLWLHGTPTPGTAGCTSAGNGLWCTGVSSVLASQGEAEDEASDAAIEAVAFELGRKVNDASWKAVIPGMYSEARDEALAALARDPRSTQAQRAVHDAHRTVSHALSSDSSNPPSASVYWEAFDTAEGRRYVAVAAIDMDASTLAGKAATYPVTTSALGATAVKFFPELAWRFPKVAHGAVITKLEHGPLQDLGLAEHYIVLAIDGREVIDAASFQRIADEESAQLAEHGGILRLLVQTDSGDPREFSRTIAGKAQPESTPRPHEQHDNVPPTGGVNVWDRYGGGRNDPRN